ncbi:hypothetical protein H4R33_001804 [Dimargaris cristalligena]|nr:hypothetical protein H4R33_001804 [Dimargaris cristalligena]
MADTRYHRTPFNRPRTSTSASSTAPNPNPDATAAIIIARLPISVKLSSIVREFRREEEAELQRRARLADSGQSLLADRRILLAPAAPFSQPGGGSLGYRWWVTFLSHLWQLGQYTA